MARRRIVAAAATALTLPLISLLPASASASASATVVAAAPTSPSDVRELSRKDFTFNGKRAPADTRYQPNARARAQALAAETPPVGTVRAMLALDDFNGIIYLKPYTLRGVGD